LDILNKTKILHVVWSLELAGAEKLAFDMVQTLPLDSFCPIVCSVNNDGILGDMLRQDGYTVYHREKKPGLDWGTVRWLREIIMREQVDVIHAHQYSPMVYSVLAAFGCRKLKIIYTEHGRNYPEKRRWKRTFINPLLARMIDCIVSISEHTRQAMIEYDRLPGKRIRVIHNGVDFHKIRGVADINEKRRELEIPDGYGVVGSAARLDEVKNLPMMLRAFQRVVMDRSKTLLLIAGTGTLENRMKGLARELGIERKVRFVGLRHDLPDLMRIFNIFLLTSFTEGISITLLEAMANGIPAVVTKVGGNPEVVVDGETGYLVPLGEDKKMAERILELLGNPETAGKMGTRGMERVGKSFSFTRMMASYLDVYGVGPDVLLRDLNKTGVTE
jgi:L-malate glycosyltransferase